MKYIILILALCLTGCDSGYQRPIDHQQAVKICHRNDGYNRYVIDKHGKMEVWCNDNAYFYIKREGQLNK